MKIQYKFSPDITKNDYILTIDGAEIGHVNDREYAEAIETAFIEVAELERQVEKLIRENDNLTAALHHLRAK